MLKALILQLNWVYAKVLLLYPAAVLLLSQTIQSFVVGFFCVIHTQYSTVAQGCNIGPKVTAHLIFVLIWTSAKQYIFLLLFVKSK